VKLDRSHNQRKERDHRYVTLIRGLIRVSQDLGLREVIERIKTAEQCQCLRVMGCRVGLA